MSDIFVSTQISKSPIFVNGFENLFTRVAGLTTNSLSFATIGQIEILPNVFNNDLNNARIEFEFLGQVTGVLGNKQFRSQIDGVTVYTPPSANASTNPGTFRIKVIVIFRNGQFMMYMRTTLGDSGTGSLVINSLGSVAAGFAPYDTYISHMVTLQALVVNAADSIRCDWIGASFR